ncbi:MAG: winged helix-turn-helix domain-containing protein [Ruegeria sp.]
MEYHFADFVLSRTRHTLTRSGERIYIEPLVFDLLHLLVREAGELVTRDQMVDEIWQGRFVSESAISACVAAARRAIGDSGKEQSIIRTVPRRGFVLVADVEVVSPENPASTGAVDATVSRDKGSTNGGGAVIPSIARSERDRPSLAVLPFGNKSIDPDQDFLAEGIVEDVTTELSRFRELVVMARNSSFAYQDSGKDTRQIAEELGVQYVVEGSVRRAGDRLRVAAQLIDAENGSHVWADRWDRTMDDLFALQDELTSAIVTAVHPELGANERARALSKPVESLSVWELCHRANDWQTRIDSEKFDECEQLLRRALELEPDSIRANVLLARLQVSRVFLGIGRDWRTELADCLVAAKRAVELDSRSDEAHRALGISLMAAGHYDEALASVERGIRLNPNNGGLYYARAFCWLRPPYASPEKVAEDMGIAERLSPRDPLRVHYYGVTGEAWMASGIQGSEEKALAAFEVAACEPNTIWIYTLAAAAIHAKR